MTRIPVRVEIASEFRYRKPILDKNGLVIIISQSGETADSLAALREAKKQGVKTLGIINVVGSSIAREADYVMYTLAGPEIAVATTKAFSTQLIANYLLAIEIAHIKRKINNTPPEQRSLLQKFMHKIIQIIDKVSGWLSKKGE
jgi:glucosamine--fructose-6-phosphate aminotransferase (isomerizing)